MSRTEFRRKVRAGRRLPAETSVGDPGALRGRAGAGTAALVAAGARCGAALLLGLAAAAPARAAESLWDTVLETMNVKAAPPGPAPDFVERTRPDAAGLGYLPTAVPHKVSPLPVKSAAQIDAAKAALDAAKARQLAPGAPKPLPSARGGKGLPPRAD